MVSVRSLTSCRSSRSKSTTGSAGVFRTGSPKRRMFWIDNAFLWGQAGLGHQHGAVGPTPMGSRNGVPVYAARLAALLPLVALPPQRPHGHDEPTDDAADRHPARDHGRHDEDRDPDQEQH